MEASGHQIMSPPSFTPPHFRMQGTPGGFAAGFILPGPLWLIWMDQAESWGERWRLDVGSCGITHQGAGALGEMPCPPPETRGRRVEIRLAHNHLGGKQLPKLARLLDSKVAVGYLDLTHAFATRIFSRFLSFVDFLIDCLFFPRSKPDCDLRLNELLPQKVVDGYDWLFACSRLSCLETEECKVHRTACGGVRVTLRGATWVIWV